jgi:predicted ribosome quality control (RQC) complex YloA/Tae2 family protein
MNQDQVKDKLLLLEPDVEEFSVIFSGKTSKKVHGLYHPDTREIIIHNRNFSDEAALMYTAIHEFAHHIHFTTSDTPVSNRAHTTAFRSIFHELLQKAETMGVYENTLDRVDELQQLAESMRQRFIRANGELMKDFGHALMEAEKLCRKHGARFEDFVERVLQLPKTTATTLMKVKAMDLPPDLGYENMKTLASVRNKDARGEAIEAFRQGLSPDMVKQGIKDRGPVRQSDPKKKLEGEKRRIERSLESLRSRLEEIEHELERMLYTEDHVS